MRPRFRAERVWLCELSSAMSASRLRMSRAIRAKPGNRLMNCLIMDRSFLTTWPALAATKAVPDLKRAFTRIGRSGEGRFWRHCDAARQARVVPESQSRPGGYTPGDTDGAGAMMGLAARAPASEMMNGPF